MRSKYLTLGVLLLVACDDPSKAREEFAGAIRDSAGVEIVEHRPAGSRTGTVDGILRHVLTIGETTGDSEYEFGDVSGLAVLSDGSIAVMDRQVQRIRLYSRDGVHLRSLGGPGSGPGEFSPQVFSLFAGRGDTIIVPDLGNTRVTLFPLAGDASSFALRMEEYLPMGFGVSSDGDLVAQLRSVAGPTASPVVDDVLAELALDGTIADTLMTLKRGELFEAGGGITRFTIFAPEPRWTLLDDGLVAYGSSDAYRVQIAGPGGKLRRIVELAERPLEVTSSERDVIRARVQRMLRANGVPEERLRPMLDGLRIAARWPAFSRLHTGPDQTIWMQRVRHLDEMTDDERGTWNPFQTGRGDTEWIVLRSDGRFFGTIGFPPRFHPIVFSRDRVFGVYRDELDVQSIRAYAIRLPGGG